MRSAPWQEAVGRVSSSVSRAACSAGSRLGGLLALRPPDRPFGAPGGGTPFPLKLLGVGCVGIRTEPAAYGPPQALLRSVLTVTLCQQLGKLRHREANALAQGFTAGDWRSWV